MKGDSIAFVEKTYCLLFPPLQLDKRDFFTSKKVELFSF